MKTQRKRIESIDWQEVRDRLSRSAEALEQAHRLSPERVRAVLEERARTAAQVPPQALEAGAAIEVVLFSLGEECYALETSCMREILRLKELAPLPGTPDFLIGVTNLRGQILAILDLRRFFGIEPRDNTDRTRVMVLGQERVEFGLLADSVQEVTLLRLDEIGEAPASVLGAAREYLRGVTANALLVLDGAVLLNDPRLYIDLGEDGAAASPEVKS
jgi:purine-binding chemotaxis protein CheW